MKKIQIILLCLVCFALFAVSCSKEESGGITSNALRLMDTENDGVAYSQYSYDTQGRCTQINGATFSYGTSSVTQSNANGAGITTFLLNSRGLVSKESYTSSDYSYETLYEHDANGFVSKTTRQSKFISISTGKPTTYREITQYYRDADGDPISAKLTQETTPYKISFITDKNHENTLDEEFRGLKWKGKMSTHPITAIVKTPDDNSGYKNITTENYIYTYDNKGYITKKITNIATTIGTTNINSTYTYNYTYK
jgi:hypothetical protein